MKEVQCSTPVFVVTRKPQTTRRPKKYLFKIMIVRLWEQRLKCNTDIAKIYLRHRIVQAAATPASGTKAYSTSPFFSYSAISRATMTLSLTTCSGSFKNFLSVSSTPSQSPKLPKASAASCRTIPASLWSLSASVRLGIDAGWQS